MSVTHVAGPIVRIGDRAIQRCAVCGDKLADNLNKMSPDGEFSAWAEAALVQVSGNRSSVVGEFDKMDSLPSDFCLALVE